MNKPNFTESEPLMSHTPQDLNNDNFGFLINNSPA